MRRSFAAMMARAAASAALAATLAGASAARAQAPGEGLVRAAAGAAMGGVAAVVRVADEIRVREVPGLSPMAEPDPGYAPPPRAWRETMVIEEAVPPFEVERILQARGFEPLGQPVRRRWVYTVSAINPDGEDGRVVVDAHTGRILRFIPAEVSDAEVLGAYGPAGLPVHRASVRNLKPPMPIPHAGPRVASRTPAANPAPRPEPKAESKAPSGTEPKSAAAVPPAAAQARAEARPAEARPTPPKVELQPTQEMPPVQGLE